MKELLIFSVGMIVGGTVLFFVFFFLFGVRLKMEDLEMFGKKLCSDCKTGKLSYELDKRSTECPYLYCHNGKTCSMYKKLDKKKKAELKTVSKG